MSDTPVYMVVNLAITEVESYRDLRLLLTTVMKQLLWGIHYL